MSYSTRSGRQITRKRHFDEISASAESKTQSKSKKPRAKPTVNALTEAPMLIRQLIRLKAEFTPPVQVEFKPFETNWLETEPIDLFLRFLGTESLTAIVEATNARAEAEQQRLKKNVFHPRYWRPTTRGEVLQWLGILFHMGRHIEKCRSDYWRIFSWPISKNRWDQIHRFLGFNTIPSTETSSISHKLEPVATIIRNNCRSAVIPPSWVAVDEIMVAFDGRSVHKTSIRNKPIPTGFKI